MEPQIYGYSTKDTNNKISFYTDDIPLYITRPQITIPNFLDKINLFGTFSRINWTKSVLISIHVSDLAHLDDFPFTVSPDKFTYFKFTY